MTKPGPASLDHIGDIDEVTRENFELPLSSNFMALAAFAVLCGAARATVSFLTAWVVAHARHIHTITVGDAFDVIDDIKKHGTESLKMSPDELIGMLPTSSKLAMLLGDGVANSIVSTLRHGIGHMMSITPELALVGHLHQLVSLPVVQHAVDGRLREMATELGEPQPQTEWLTLGHAVNGRLPLITTDGAVDVQLHAAIVACAEVGDMMADAASTYDSFAERLTEKRKAAESTIREGLRQAAEALKEETSEDHIDA